MAESETELDRFTNATPRPWHVYEGGNFIKIGADGYDEFVKRRHYLGGPLVVAEMHYHATENYEADRDKAIANARLIVAAVNTYSPSDAEQLVELRRLAVEARDVLALLVPYGKIHTVEGVAYPDGTHSEAVDRGERVLNQIRKIVSMNGNTNED